MALALINGEILTMESHPPRADAILIEDEKIVALGSTEEILNLAPRYTKLIDLEGKVATPGFIDSHTHLVSYGLDLARPDLSVAKSSNEALEIVREAIKPAKPPNPLIAVRWDESKWRDSHIPTLEELDRATHPYPVILRRVCGHLAIANRAALKLLPSRLKKVDWRKGLLLEDAALNLNRIFPPSQEEVMMGLSKAMDLATRLGVTSIHDIASLRYYRIYKNLQEQAKLKLRVYICFPYREINKLIRLNIRRESGDKWLKVGGVKIFADGSLGAKTAALSHPYRGSLNLGVLNHPYTQLVEMMRKTDENGFQLFIHAIGDQAIEQVLSAYENLLTPGNPFRHRIEHFEIASLAQIKKLKRLNIIASMQPNFVTWQHPGGLYERILGVRRNKLANRIGDLIRTGVTVAFGSDCMPFSPCYGLWGAVEHPNPVQRISILEAIRTYTIKSAYASFDEKTKGSLTPGKLADLIVLSENPFKSKNMRENKVLLTIIDGEVVHSDSKKLKIVEKS